MVNDVLGSLDLTRCAEIALLLFFIVFISVSIRALFTKRKDSAEMAHIPLDEAARRDNHG